MSKRSGSGPVDPEEREDGNGEHRSGPHLPGFTDATGGERDIAGSEILAHEEALPRAGQRDFEPDVEEIHRPIFREPRDPLEGREPAPWWLWAIAAGALFWGGWYLGRRGGDFGLETHTAYSELGEEIRAEAAEQGRRAAVDPLEAGRTLYSARCQACHQPSGGGTPGVFPPLIGSDWVTGPPAMPVLVVLQGLQGPITVAGVPYNGAMPAWKDLMSDAEIAAVVSYIRQWQGNNAPPVTPELVTRLRAATQDQQTPWTERELRDALRSADVSGAGQDSVTSNRGAR